MASTSTIESLRHSPHRHKRSSTASSIIHFLNISTPYTIDSTFLSKKKKGKSNPTGKQLVSVFQFEFGKRNSKSNSHRNVERVWLNDAVRRQETENFFVKVPRSAGYQPKRQHLDINFSLLAAQMHVPITIC